MLHNSLETSRVSPLARSDTVIFLNSDEHMPHPS